jgi:hypothetical protein
MGDRLLTVLEQRGFDSVDEFVRNVDLVDDGLEEYDQRVNRAYNTTEPIDGLDGEAPLFRFIKGMDLATDRQGNPLEAGVIEESRFLADYADPVIDRENFRPGQDFERGGDRRFIGVPSVHTVGLYGMDPWRSKMPPAPDPRGDRTAAEIIDVYLMEQLRDVPFADWPNELPDPDNEDLPADVQQALESDIDSIEREYDGGTWWYDSDRLFVEADTDEVDWGPYVSQFLLQELKLWALNADQEYLRYPKTDFNDSREQWLRNIAGEGTTAAETDPRKPPSPDDQDGSVGPIATPRHLATIVNAEPPFQEYLIATIRLLDEDFDPDLPFTKNTDEPVFGYNETGPVGVLDMVTRAGRQALLAAFYHKWRRHFRCRPETYSGRVHDQRKGEAYGLSSLVTDADILDARKVAKGNTMRSADPGGDFLSSAYVEGSPVHPAYPSGHSVIAGACGTVLKTWFRDDPLPFDDIYVPAADGQNIVKKATGDIDADLTIYQELDKLMSNVGLARMFAGVHYYSDHYRGVKLGEQVAVGMMVDIFRREYTGDKEIRPTFKPYLEYDEDAEREVSIATLNDLRREAARFDANDLWVTA